jgi:predicted component of type VI protein secretion system
MCLSDEANALKALWTQARDKFASAVRRDVHALLNTRFWTTPRTTRSCFHSTP